MLALGVDAGGLVLEGAHRRTGDRRLGARRVALPHEPVVDLLAGQPGAPRRRPAGAVGARVLEDPVGVGDLAVGGEADARAPPMAGTSELTAMIQPPSGVANVAAPSGKIGKE